MGGQDDNWKIGVENPDPAQNLGTIEVWKSQIEHHPDKWCLLGKCNTTPSIIGDSALKPSQQQPFGKRIREGAFVIYEQYCRPVAADRHRSL
jgi:hypothetical protein